MKLLTFLLLAASTSLFAAKDEKVTRIFDLPFDQVWSACVGSAAENYIVVNTDKEDGILTFKNQYQGKWIIHQVEFEVGVFVSRVTNSQTKITLTLKTVHAMNRAIGKHKLEQEYLGAVDHRLHP